MHEIEFPGDRRHPDHEAYLLKLGRATYACAELANIAFNLLRIFDGRESGSLYDDPLGRLEDKCKALFKKQPSLPHLADFISKLGPAREFRNDLLHALPVKDGLHRRSTKNPHHVRNYFSVEDFDETIRSIREAFALGYGVLYHDGGKSIEAWRNRGNP